MAVSEAFVARIVKLLVISPSIVLLVTTIWYLPLVLVRAVLIPVSILIQRMAGTGTAIAEQESMAGSGAITVVSWAGFTVITGEATQR